jgi:predicted lipid-binding transport protein (Tim44 family)
MDIVFFACLAFYIFFKLRDQLGKVSDEDRIAIIKQKQEKLLFLQNKLVEIDNIQNKLNEADTKILAPLEESLKQTLLTIFQSCQISAEFFVNGAKSAFEMIVKAFAGNDLETLKFLLGEKIYQNFESAIAQRKLSEKNLHTSVISIDKTEILSASLNEKNAIVTVKFTSQQINYFTDNAAQIIDGKKDEISELSDVWTFQKDVSSNNPNWVVTMTG